MKWTDVPTGETHGAFQHFMVALGNQADVAVRRINAEQVFAERLAVYAIDGGVVPTVSQKRAREIMGTNMLGIEEAIRHFGVNPTRRQYAALSVLPCTESELEECRNSHVLVAPMLSILKVREKLQGKGLLYPQDWYDNQPFASECEICWQLVRKTEVPSSTSKNWQEQQALLGKNDETPTAKVMVYTIIGHHLNTGEQLFEKLYVRTSSVYSDGNRVYVGDFDAKGLLVHGHWDDFCHDYLGVSAARKFD